MGGSSGGGSSTTTLRYAPYIEVYHNEFLDTIWGYRNAIINSSPFASYSPLDLNTMFFGAGVGIGAYGATFNKFVTYVQNLDTDALYKSIFNDTVNGAEVKNLVVAEGAQLDEDIVINSYPRLMTGARDLNAVMSSTFVVAKGLIEASRIKALSKFSAGLRYSLIPQALDRWKTRLTWNNSLVGMYNSMVNQYIATSIDLTNQKYEMAAKNTLWPFTVLDHQRAALGALQAASTSKSVAGDGGSSTASKAIGGAMSGAAAGYMIGTATAATTTTVATGAGAAAASGATTGSAAGPWGAAIGAVVGGVAGLLMN